MPATAADSPVTSLDDLIGYFRSAAKPRATFRVGIEHERIPVREDGMPVPYVGPGGIADLMSRLAESWGAKRIEEDGNIVALERGAESITLEPGGQLELSGAALPTAAGCAVALQSHVEHVGAMARSIGISFIAGGFRPFGGLDDVPWLPKRRYTVMREYLPTRGRLAHEMMKRTATVQANLDFADEAEACEKTRTGMGVSSVVTALYAASPIAAGQPNGHKSYRAAVWLETDEDRCGFPRSVFEPGFCFRGYAEWALDVPMFFVVREGVYHPAGGMTFRRFLAEGWRGERARLSDWGNHLSTLFPEVRLKKTIELRGADAAPLPFAKALGALWRGLLDDPEACAAAWALVSSWPYDERVRLRREVPRAGLAARVAGRSLDQIAVELCRIAEAGLARLPAGAGDQPLLAPLLDYAKRGRCPADDMLADFARLSGDPRRLVQTWDLMS